MKLNCNKIIKSHIKTSLFADSVPFLYTSPVEMPHRFFMGFKSGLLAGQSRSYIELASNHERDAQDT